MDPETKNVHPPSNNADGQAVDEETKRSFFAADEKIYPDTL